MPRAAAEGDHAAEAMGATGLLLSASSGETVELAGPVFTSAAGAGMLEGDTPRSSSRAGGRNRDKGVSVSQCQAASTQALQLWLELRTEPGRGQR